jgi:hypothetical protein
VSIEGIKELIERLPPDDQAALASWVAERDARAWDAQIEQDFSPGGVGMALLEEVDRQIAAGKLENFKVSRLRGRS